MTDETEIIEQVRRRAVDPQTRTDWTRVALPELSPPASEDALAKAEQALGHVLRRMRRRLLREVGNGRFGPGQGVIGTRAVARTTVVPWLNCAMCCSGMWPPRGLRRSGTGVMAPGHASTRRRASCSLLMRGASHGVRLHFGSSVNVVERKRATAPPTRPESTHCRSHRLDRRNKSNRGVSAVARHEYSVNATRATGFPPDPPPHLLARRLRLEPTGAKCMAGHWKSFPYTPFTDINLM